MKSLKLLYLAASVSAVAICLALFDAVKMRGAAPPKPDNEPDEDESVAEEFRRVVNCASGATYGRWERPS